MVMSLVKTTEEIVERCVQFDVLIPYEPFPDTYSIIVTDFSCFGLLSSGS